MNARTILLILLAGLANGQLNFEGNPLTENTEYTAEESRFYERTARQEATATNITHAPEYPQNHRPLLSDTKELVTPIREASIDGDLVKGNSSRLVKEQRSIGARHLSATYNQGSSNVDQMKVARYLGSTTYNQTPSNIDNKEVAGHLSTTYNQIPSNVDQTEVARHLSATYNQAPSNVDQAEVALNSFLNSKTPEESRQSLDHYLQSRDYPQRTIDVDQQLLTQSQPPLVQQAVSSPVNRHLTTQLIQQRQGLAVNQPVYNAPANPMGTPSLISNQQPMQPFGMQSRNDVFYPEWYHRVRKVRGKPFPYAQSRGGPGFYNGPPPSVPFKPKGPPVEVIYTKPPGFHNGPPISNPPVPYEDASAWFPEADHPPPPKDVYYSQLYAQSYDPYYYNYIAKTGKIKPHLYGKLGKHEEDDGGIWSELYRGFKKHGLKNIMTPTFLLGMTLPVVTLMLSALVQKRSLARSDTRGFPTEDTVQEYLEQVQRAVECHGKRNRRRRRDTGGC